MPEHRNNPHTDEKAGSQIITPKQAAAYLGLHVITVYRLIKKGKLPGFKVGGQWRFKKDLLDNWILENIKKLKNTA